MIDKRDWDFIWVVLDEMINRGDVLKANYVNRLTNIKAKGLNNDKLDIIFQKQIELQKKCGGIIEDKNELIGNQDYITIMTLAIVDEFMEALGETPWKPWKKQQTLNLDNMKEELVDGLHFFVNLCLAAGMNANEVFKIYCRKNDINLKRQDDGY